MNELPLKICLGDAARLEEYREVFFDSLLWDRYFADDDRLRGSLCAALQKRELLVAAHGEEVVGVMEVRLDGFFGGFPYLALLGVKKGWRGMGAGHQLLRFYEAMAREAGYVRASIMVSSFNPRARRLYQSVGYRKIGYLDDAFKPGNGEYILVKDLR